MRRLIAMVLAPWLAGCADLGYYWHNASGHLDLMDRRVAIDDLLADPGTDAALGERLRLVLEMRRFAVERLALPDNDSYRAYVALDRPWVVQNLVAAPEFSTRLKRWCYPVIGCATYRGYFDVERLRRYAAELAADGYDVATGRIPAYSSLGWFDDPVLSTFVDWPEGRLAGLIFHELTHQRLYVDDDTAFNESLATAVQQVGAELWLRARGREAEIAALQARARYRAAVTRLVEDTRARLDTLYAGRLGADDKRAAKAAILDDARDRHRVIAADHGISGGYTRWFGEGLNNARLGSLSTYRAAAPAFVAMLDAHGRDFGAFFAYVDGLGELDRSSRDACVAAWAKGRSGTPCPAMVAG